MLPRDGGAIHSILHHRLHPAGYRSNSGLYLRTLCSFVSHWNTVILEPSTVLTHMCFSRKPQMANISTFLLFTDLLLQILIVAECKGGTSHISNPTAPYAPHGCILPQRCLILLDACSAVNMLGDGGRGRNRACVRWTQSRTCLSVV